MFFQPWYDRRFLTDILNYLATSSCLCRKMQCFSFKWILFIRSFRCKFLTRKTYNFWVQCSDYFLVHSDVIFSFRYFITTVYSNLHLVCNQQSWIARFSSLLCNHLDFIMLINTISLFFWKYLPIIKAILYYVFNNRKL